MLTRTLVLETLRSLKSQMCPVHSVPVLDKGSRDLSLSLKTGPSGHPVV